MENGHAVQVVTEVDGIPENTQSLITIFSHPNIGNNKVAVFAVSGEESSPWKTFVLNSMMRYLSCEGNGDWLGLAWKNRTESLFYGNKIQLRQNGIYCWSNPFLMENSTGETYAVILMDIVAKEHGNALKVIAGLMSSTLICIDTTQLESSTLDIFQKFNKQNEYTLMEQLGFEQLVTIIFDSTLAVDIPFGPSKRISYMSEKLGNTTEVHEFLGKIKMKECWLLPEQALNDSILQPGKEFTRHFKKLISSTIFDVDLMPHICSPEGKFLSRGELLNYLSYDVDKVRAVLKTGVFENMTLAVAENVENKLEDPALMESTDDLHILEDVEMLDLSETSANPIHSTENNKYDKIIKPQFVPDEFAKTNSFTDTMSTKVDNIGNLSSHTSNETHLKKTKVHEHSLTDEYIRCKTYSYPVSTELEKKDYELSNQEKDNLLQKYIGNIMTYYKKWLQKVYLAQDHANIQQQNLDCVDRILKDVEEFCTNICLHDINEIQRLLAKQLDIESRKILRGKSEIIANVNQLETHPIKTWKTVPQACPIPEKLSEEEINKLFKTHFENIIHDYRKAMGPIVDNLQCSLEELINCNQDLVKVGIQNLDKFCKCNSLEDTNERKDFLDKAFLDEYKKAKMCWEENQEQLKTHNEKISAAFSDYKNLIFQEIKPLIYHPISWEQIQIYNQAILRKVIPPSIPKYKNYILSQMEKLTAVHLEPYRSIVDCISKYSNKMNRMFELHNCFSVERFHEFSSRAVKTIQSEFKYVEMKDLFNEGILCAVNNFRLRNTSIQEQENKLGEYAFSQVKNFYNNEMKFRLESNVYRKNDLQKLHEDLKNDCVAAFTKACNFHKDSGIPSLEPSLREELDKCFTSFLHSNGSKLEKSITTISASLRKFKNQCLETVDNKVKSSIQLSPNNFDTIFADALKEVSKLLEIEIRKIPLEDFETHNETLKSQIEAEIFEIRADNLKRWKIHLDQEREEKERKRKEDEEKRKELLKNEAEEKKRQLEEKQEREKNDAERKREERMRKDKAADKLKREEKHAQENAAEKNKTEANKLKDKENEKKERRKHENNDNFNSSPFQHHVCNEDNSKHDYSTGRKPIGSSPCNELKTSSRQSNTSGYSNQSDSFVIGIEFGLTKIHVGIIKDGSYDPIKNKWGEEHTVNTISFTDSEILIGKEAEFYSGENIIFHCAMDNILNKVAEKVESAPTIHFKGKPLVLHKELLCGLILSSVKKDAEAYLKTNISQAVIAVPLWYNSTQRQETKDSGVIAGFSHVHLINDNTAAALAFSKEDSRVNSAHELLVAVTSDHHFDVAVYSYSRSEIKMLSNCGYGLLSYPLYYYVTKYIFKEHTKKWQIIKAATEEAKKLNKNKLDLNEVVLVTNTSDLNVVSNLRIYGRLIDRPDFIRVGAARFAENICSGSNIHKLKDLCTLGFNYKEENNPKTKQIFLPLVPFGTPQRVCFNFGTKKELNIQILEGTSLIGTLRLSVISPLDDVKVNVNFKLTNEGIFSKEIKVDDECPQTKHGLRIGSNLVLENLKPDEITNLQKVLQSLQPDLN